MMREIYFLKIILWAAILSSPFLCKGQQHYPDEWWPLGKVDTTNNPNYGNALIHFVGDSAEISLADLGMSFEASVAVASDTQGNLLFYSNGCEIRNAQGNLMSNGDDINHGSLHDLVCTKGYVMPRSMTVIPKPGSNDTWYMLHLGGRYDPIRRLVYEKLYFTEIEIATPNENGVVLQKNVQLLDGDLEPFSLVRHGNGRDWWLICTAYNTNRYYKWRISPDGISEENYQDIGEAMSCTRAGGSIFSDNGTKYARTNNCHAVAMDFDRCAGLFSNPIEMARPELEYGDGGLAFSKSNQWLYATSNLCMFRADLQASEPFLDSLYKRPYFLDESVYVYGTSLMYMQQTPNGRIFMNSRHQEKYFSTIDIMEDSSILQVKGFPLPVNTVRTMPYFPNYRLFDLANSPCDTLGIDAPTSIANPHGDKALIKCYPNPFTETVTVIISESAIGATFLLYDALGELVFKEVLRTEANTFNWKFLPDGVYFYTLNSFERDGIPNVTGKWVKKTKE